MVKKRHNNTKAFTLSELLLVVAIMAFVFSSIIITLMACFLLNEMNRNLSIAATHAQYVAEDIKDTASTLMGFSGLSAQITDGDWNWNATEINTAGLAALDNETIATSVSGTSLLDINVTVNWKDRRRSRNMSLETLVAEP